MVALEDVLEEPIEAAGKTATGIPVPAEIARHRPGYWLIARMNLLASGHTGRSSRRPLWSRRAQSSTIVLQSV